MEAEKHWNTARFGVKGQFTFVAQSILEIHPHELRLAVEAVDAEFPWKPYPESDGEYKSIDFMSAISGEKVGDTVVYTFTVCPVATLKPSMTYAYHRYLCSLADQVAMRHADKIYSVEVQILLDGGTSTYFTPQGKQRQQDIAASQLSLGQLQRWVSSHTSLLN